MYKFESGYIISIIIITILSPVTLWPFTTQLLLILLLILLLLLLLLLL